MNDKTHGLLMSVILFLGLCASANAATAPLVYAYNQTTNRLIAFRADSPTVLRNSVAFSGLNAGETITGIDFRPATGQLFASGIYSSGGNLFFRYLIINPWTGAATQFGPTAPLLSQSFAYSFDFSPTADVIRQTNSGTANFRFRIASQDIISDTSLAYAAGDPSGNTTPSVANIAYMNSFPGSTSTTLYGIDFATDKLVRIGGVNANPSPNLGQLTSIGSLGVTTESERGGFDIYGTSNLAYAALRVSGTSKLYRINLTNGAATLVGNIGNGTDTIDGLAVAPANSPFDFDGDGRAEIAVFRQGSWYRLNSSDNSFSGTQFGASTDKIVPADYDGDRRSDIAVFRSGVWYILSTGTNAFRAVSFGQAGDVPVPGDYDGDGSADVAVFRSGTWFIRNSSTNGFRGEQFGASTDQPVVGDFDADGRQDLAVFRSGTWYVNGSTAGFYAAQFGLASDKPVAADYDGDGKTDLAVFRGGDWYISQSSNNQFRAVSFGFASDLTIPADYDGDGRADVAVFRSGNWFVLNSQNNSVRSTTFGQSSDVPVQTAYLP